MKKTVAAVASLMILSAAQAALAQAVPLRINLQPGQSWTFDSTQSTDTDSKATVNGEAHPFKTSTNAHRAGKMEVLAANNGAPTSIRVTYAADCKNSQGMGGQSQDMPFPFAGKTVTVTKNGDGSITDDYKDQVDPEAMNELHQVMDQNAAMFSKDPVTVGQEWAGDPAAIARLMQLEGPNDRAGMTMKLLSLGSDGGRPIANVKVSLAAVRDMNGMSVKIISQGTAVVDVTTGHVTKLDMKGTSDMSGTQQGPGQDGNPVQYQIEGHGTVNIANTSSAVGGSDVPHGGGNVPLSGGDVPHGNVNDNPLGGGGNNPLGGGGGNPLAPAMSPFAGHFSDGKLTVDLTGPSDRLSGSFAIGGQVYPATAHATGDVSIEGSFNAGGTSYPFKGMMKGDNMTVTSGGQNYDLSKASMNPLGR